LNWFCPGVKEGGKMTLKRAKEILGSSILEDGSLRCSQEGVHEYMDFKPGQEEITLDGDFTAEQIDAIATYMRKAGK
jgi:hypothetical protein